MSWAMHVRVKATHSNLLPRSVPRYQIHANKHQRGGPTVKPPPLLMADTTEGGGRIMQKRA